jgi:hypothetical protein
LRPGPFAGLAVSVAAPAGLLSFFCASCASWACFRSVEYPNQFNCPQIYSPGHGCYFPCDVPFSASLLRLCVSNSSSVPSLLTVASLLVFARSSTMGLSNKSNPCTSSIAEAAESASSKTMKACPFALRFFLATISRMVPYSLNISFRASFSCSILMRSSRLRTYIPAPSQDSRRGSGFGGTRHT